MGHIMEPLLQHPRVGRRYRRSLLLRSGCEDDHLYGDRPGITMARPLDRGYLQPHQGNRGGCWGLQRQQGTVNDNPAGRLLSPPQIPPPHVPRRVPSRLRRPSAMIHYQKKTSARRNQGTNVARQTRLSCQARPHGPQTNARLRGNQPGPV